MADGTALKEEREKKCVGEKERKINLEISLSLLGIPKRRRKKGGNDDDASCV
jgi:hypothetical protein